MARKRQLCCWVVFVERWKRRRSDGERLLQFSMHTCRYYGKSEGNELHVME